MSYLEYIVYLLMILPVRVCVCLGVCVCLLEFKSCLSRVHISRSYLVKIWITEQLPFSFHFSKHLYLQHRKIVVFALESLYWSIESCIATQTGTQCRYQKGSQRYILQKLCTLTDQQIHFVPLLWGALMQGYATEARSAW